MSELSEIVAILSRFVSKLPKISNYLSKRSYFKAYAIPLFEKESYVHDQPK